MARRRPGRLLTALGVFTLVVGIVGALVLVVAATQRRSNAVDSLARAPVGCDTTLDFAETGEYFVFVERAGSIDAVRGDCDADGDYSVEGGIDVVIEIVDPDGTSIELDRVIGSVDYDVSGFVGEAAFTIDVSEAGDHVMRVESDDGPFVVAVGPDPSNGVTVLFAAAVLAGVLGLVVGAGLMLAARSRRNREFQPAGAPLAPAAAFSPVGRVPHGPPTYTQPGGPVHYGPPTAAAPGAVPPAYGANAPVPTRPPSAPSGIPRYEPPTPQVPPAPPAGAPPTSVPQIPGEPTWVAPGGQPTPPPPGAAQPPAVPAPQPGGAPDSWAQAPDPTPTPSAPTIPPPAPNDLDAEAKRRSEDVTGTASSPETGGGDDTPTVERPRWGGPPPN